MLKFLLIKENDSFKHIFLKWIFYLIPSVLIYFALSGYFEHYDFIYNYFKSTADCCVSICEDSFIRISVIISPILETILFMYLPFRFFHNKGLIAGIIIWCLLHISYGIFFMIYISIMGFFYYQLMKYNKWKQVIFFHGLINWTSALTCI
jgi:hypothetical protein